MTVIVGVLCKDGAVVGADSSTTFATAQSPTIEQLTNKKVYVVSNCVLLAGTGQIGLGQRFHSLVEEYWNSKGWQGKNAVTIGMELSNKVVQNFSFTAAPKGEYGGLVAFPSNGKFHLCEFAVRDLQPELKTETMWFVSMGSGQILADPFLGFLRKVFWEKEQPTINEGIFAAVWTLQHAIELNPGGINGPIQIGLLTTGKEKGQPYYAKIVDENELLEHKDFVKEAESHLRSYKKSLQGPPRKQVPEVKI